MSTTRVAFILGAGPRIGASLAKKFANEGYSVAVASRSGTNSKTHEGYLSLKADFAQPEQIAGLFTQIKNEFHAAPSVVIYNGASRTVPPDEKNMFSLPVEGLVNDLNVNTVSAWAAVQAAVEHWASLSKGEKKTFIYTGNRTNVFVIPMPATLGLGVSKTASAYWIELAEKMNQDKSARFFYADERTDDGTQAGMNIDGDAHADFYAHLATNDPAVPWHATFVKNKGYAKFQN